MCPWRGPLCDLGVRTNGVPVTLVTSSPRTQPRSTAESQGAPASAPGPLNHSPRTPGPQDPRTSPKRLQRRGRERGAKQQFLHQDWTKPLRWDLLLVPKSDLARCTPLANLQPPAWPLGVKALSPEIRAPRRHHLSPRSWLWKQMFLITCRGFIVESQPWDTVSGLGVPPTPARHLPASSLFSLGTILQVAGHPFL